LTLNANSLNAVPLGGRAHRPLAGRPYPAEPQFDVRATPAVARDFYALQVRDTDGVCLAIITDWYGAQRWAVINEPGTLQFTVPGDSDSAAYLVLPNQIWVYRAGYTMPVGIYPIDQTRAGGAHATWITVQCSGLLAHLSHEPIPEYVIQDTTASTVIAHLLSTYQLQTPQISVGTIDSDIGSTHVWFAWESANILMALVGIQEATGGYFWVDGTYHLQWRRNAPGEDMGNTIRLGQNATRIEEHTDYSAIATRLYAVGSGTGEHRVRVTVNDAAAQAVYGIIADNYYARDACDLETLTALATAELDRRKVPRKTYPIDTVDMSVLVYGDDYEFTAHTLEPGAKVRLVCDVPAVDIVTTVTATQWDMDNPIKVRIAVSDPDSGTYGNDPVSARRTDLASMIAHSYDDTTRPPADIVPSLLTAIDPDNGLVTDLDQIIAGPLISSDFDDPETLVWWDPTTDPENPVGNLPTIIDPDGDLDDPTDVSWWNPADPPTGNLPEQMADVISTPDDTQTDTDDVRDTIRDLIEDSIADGDVTINITNINGGMSFFIAASKAALASVLVAPGTGYTQDEKRYYAHSDGDLICFSHFETAE